jgi:hypothetical protein
MPRGGNQGTAHSALVKAVQDYVSIRGGWCLKIWGNGMMRPGAPDVLAVLGGRMLGIECKTGSATLSLKQQLERDAIVRAGGLYVVVHEIEDLEDGLLAAGIVEHGILLVRRPSGQKEEMRYVEAQ